MITQFQQRQFIHMKGRFYRRDFSDMIRDTRERFTSFIFSFVHLGVLWVLKTLGVFGYHSHKEAG